MKVFRINEYEWYMAPDLETAIATAMKDSGLSRDEAVDEPYELSDADLDRLVFACDDGTHCTFRYELNRRLVADPRPQAFASTEY